MKTKLSPWWDENTKPIHPGVYKTVLAWASNLKLFSGWSYWNCSDWSDTCDTKEEAAQCRVRGEQEKKWQGIVK